MANAIHLNTMKFHTVLTQLNFGRPLRTFNSSCLLRVTLSNQRQVNHNGVLVYARRLRSDSVFIYIYIYRYIHAKSTTKQLPRAGYASYAHEYMTLAFF